LSPWFHSLSQPHSDDEEDEDGEQNWNTRECLSQDQSNPSGEEVEEGKSQGEMKACDSSYKSGFCVNNKVCLRMNLCWICCFIISFALGFGPDLASKYRPIQLGNQSRVSMQSMEEEGTRDASHSQGKQVLLLKKSKRREKPLESKRMKVKGSLHLRSCT